MASEIELTLVVTTYNRSALLLRALQSIERSVGVDFEAEVVVVDNNSADDTRAVFDAFASTAGRLPYRYVFERKQGVSNARNAAIAVARGRYIAFMDDDQECSPHLLARMRQAFVRTGADCLGGKIAYANAENLPRWLQPLVKDIGQIDLGEKDLDLTAAGPYLKEGNFAFLATTLRAIGGFDPLLGISAGKLTAGEGPAVMDEVRRRGGTMWYVHDMVQYNTLLPAKLTKRYWRRHAFGGGRSEFRASRALWAGAPKWFGIPRALYRTLVADIWGWLRAAARFDEVAAFEKQRNVLGTLGAMREARDLGE